MKNLYKCEKCGKLHESWDEANKCEDMHLDLDANSIGEFREKIVYAEGRQLPKEFMIRSIIPSKLNPETGNYEDGLPFYGVYVLKSVLSKAEAEALNAERLAKEQAERVEWMNYSKGVMDRAVAKAALDPENASLAADAERAIRSYKSAARAAGFDPDELIAAAAAAEAAPATAPEPDEADGESHGTIMLEISEPVAEIIKAALDSDCSPEEAAADAAPMSAVEAIAAAARG